MATRRAFLGAAAGVAAAMRDDGIERIAAAGRAVSGRTPQDLASDEGYWAEVRRAFDVNPAYLNLNNGGVSPSPRAVTESLAAWLALSNQAPAHTLWELAEPRVEGVRETFRLAITARTRVILVSHITNLTGQVFPVREIARLGRERGIEVIVDGAQAFAHFPFTLADLDCDYYATSLHKWLMAPHGTGFLYVRRSKISGVWPLFGAPPAMAGNIRKFEEVGTHPAANHNAIAEALALHEAIGTARKAARLRYLRDRWMRRLAALPRVRVLTSFEPALSCGIGTFHVEGTAPQALASQLFAAHRIIVTPLVHEEFDGIRVTPGVYTTADEVDQFAAITEAVIGKGLPG